MPISLIIFTTVTILSNLLIIMFALFLKTNYLIKQIGMRTLLLCMLIIMFRLLFPLQFVFEKTLNAYHLSSKIIPLFMFKVTLQGNCTIFMYHIFLYVWLIGTIIYFLRTIVSYHRFKKAIYYLPVVKDEQVHNILTQVLRKHKKSTLFKIIQTELVSTPMLFGIRNPRIVVPSMNFSKEDWRYILDHEVTHYYHYDLYTKILTDFLCGIYWWNPFIFLFRKQVDKLLEIHADLSVTKKMGELKRIQYLECLLKVAKKPSTIPVNKLSVTFNGKNTSLLSQRFHIILENHVKKSPISFVLSVSLLLLFSFTIIYEPYSFTSLSLQ